MTRTDGGGGGRGDERGHDGGREQGYGEEQREGRLRGPWIKVEERASTMVVDIYEVRHVWENEIWKCVIRTCIVKRFWKSSTC